ncbi:PTS lactose transporter subunit IIB [Allonocardiopsis opalescens]|uniref:PTS system mannitol-specific IIB component n=1 Tax=Allonocardiopsis opalescens TaxID=1144618 RepID=A0A2T0QEA2_9ACTN|nr:PTS lactose transporter subunit IIB [Allonocardiopsis opalescens]PRY02249.1 PTS system mannitol-specific IIB component [Allonocardiopsis opalescens]
MTQISGSAVKKLIVACDAGMGSSVMLTSQLAKKLSGYGVEVSHTAVDRIPGDADLVLCQQSLVSRARRAAPGTVVLGFQMFLGDPVFTKVENAIKSGGTLAD